MFIGVKKDVFIHFLWMPFIIDYGLGEYNVYKIKKENDYAPCISLLSSLSDL